MNLRHTLFQTLKTKFFCLKLLLTYTFVLFFSSSHGQEVQVNSLSELLPYLDDDNVEVSLAPGTYTVTAQNITDGDFPSYTILSDNRNNVLLLFAGNNSTYDFTGVTINVETAVFNAFSESGDFYEVQTTGNSNVIKNLTLVDVGDKEDYPKSGACNIVMDGSYNRIEGFHVTSTGSFPYGYGDAFGKGGTYTIKHYKHSTFLIRGESNHAKDNTLIHRTYGHCMFMQAASNPKIEGCYIEGEMRSTDDMLAEEGTGSPADLIDFYTVWGYRLPAGYMMSTGEAGIRAYNAGATVIDGTEYSRGTSNPTVLNCTIKHMRTGVTVAHATGTKYVEGCTAIGCENGYSLGSGDVVDCYADCVYGPVYQTTYETDKNYNAEITIIDPADGDTYYNGAKSVAYIGGSSHEVTLKSEVSNLPQDLKIKFGGEKGIVRSLYDSSPNQNNFASWDNTITNLTSFPIVLDQNTEDNYIESGGMVTDFGTNNTIIHSAISIFNVEAEEYNEMNDVTVVTSNNDTEESFVSPATDGWLEYEIEIPYPGTYTFTYSVSSITEPGNFTASIGGELIEELSFDKSGAIQSWSTLNSSTPVFLNEGTQTLKLVSKGTGWNLNALSIFLECAQVEIVPTISELNVLGNAVRSEETVSPSIFKGNSILFSPEPKVGGSWNWSGPNGFSETTREVTITNVDSDDEGEYKVVFTNDCGIQTTETFALTVQNSVLVEAEEYNSSSAGVETENTSDTTGELNVTSIEKDDWMEYSVEIPFDATYKINFRMASASDGSLTLSIDGIEKETLSYTATGGFDVWATQSVNEPMYLTAGTHTLRFTSVSSDWKLNWFELEGYDFVNPCSLPFEHDGFVVQNEQNEWTSGVFDITCASSVNAYVEMSGEGNLTSSDYVKVYYKLDGGDKTLVTDYTASLEKTSAIIRDLVGSTIEMIIETNSTSNDLSYTISKINIVETTDPFARIEAEDFDDADGPGIGTTGDVDGYQNLGSIQPGDWSMYEGLDLTGVKSINVRVGTVYDDAYIEIRLGSFDGTLIGTVDVPYTGGWQTYTTSSAYIESVTGIYDVYLVYQTIESPNPCNINWFQFSETFVAPDLNPFEQMEAEYYDAESGTSVVPTSDVSGTEELQSIEDGDWIRFDKLNVIEATNLEVRVASATAGNTIEVRLDAVDGDILSIIDVPNTGSLTTWQTISTFINSVSTEHDFYFVFKGEGSEIMALNWSKFTIYENTFARIEAEDYDSQYGSPTTGGSSDEDIDTDADAQILKSIVAGDWVLFEDVDLTGAQSVSTRFGTEVSDAFIEVRLNSATGTLLGSIPLQNTEGWHNWEVASVNIESIDGVHDVCFVYNTESSKNVCNSNWFQFSGISLEESIDALSRIEAEDYSISNGTVTNTTSDNDGKEELASIQSGDWIGFNNIFFSEAGVGGIDVRVASANSGGNIEIHSGSYDGELIATIDVPNTGSSTTWETVHTSLDKLTGESNLYFVFTGSETDLFQFNWLQFTEYETPEGYYEAENYDNMDGIETETTSDVSGEMHVGMINPNDWIMFSQVDLTDISAIDLRYSSPNTGCSVEIRLGASDGDLLTTIDLASTSSWNTWVTHKASLPTTGIDGKNDIYLVFKRDDGYVINLNWIQFFTNDYARIEAEEYDEKSGSFTIGDTTDEDGVSILKSVTPGNWVLFKNVDLSGANSVDVRAGSIYDDAFVEVRLNSSTGELIGTINLENSEGWHNWVTSSGNIDVEDGIYDVCFVFQTEASANVCNCNWFQFSPTTIKDEVIEEPRDPFARIEAEDYDEVSNVTFKTTTDVDGEQSSSEVSNDSWLLYSGIDLTEVKSIITRGATIYDGVTIEIRTGAIDGTLIGTIEFGNTGSWDTYGTVVTSIESTTGVQDIYCIFKGTESDMIYVNWFQFTSTITAIENPLEGNTNIQVYPNPVADKLMVSGTEIEKIEVYNTLGVKVKEATAQSNQTTLDLENLSSGLYIVTTTDTSGETSYHKIIKQ